MNTSQIALVSFLILIFLPCLGQQSEKKESKRSKMENYEITPETAHSNAKQLLTEEFYWSPLEESGPIGSDDGAGAFYGFKEWRKKNKKEKPIEYLRNLFIGWGYPEFNWYELDTIKIQEYLSAQHPRQSDMLDLIEQLKLQAKKEGKEFNQEEFNKVFAISSASMGSRYLTGIDQAIIAVGFGQFMLEGKIDKELKDLTIITLKRQLLPILLSRWPMEYQKTRNEQLNKMLDVLKKMVN